MGTRADFYVGTGEGAEWLGSVAWDGYQWAEQPGNPVAMASTEEEFREAVAEVMAGREDATTPDMGWPWPWNDSRLSDFAYYFADGRVAWDDRDDWPDMSAVANVTFGCRSGLLVVTRGGHR